MHHCNFCKDRLIPDVCRWYERPLLVVLVRPYYCPHCFEGFYRPVLSMREWLGYPPKKSELVQSTTSLRVNAPAPTRTANGTPQINRTRPKKSKAYKRSGTSKGLLSGFFKSRSERSHRSKYRGSAIEKPKPMKKSGFGSRSGGGGESKPLKRVGFRKNSGAAGKVSRKFTSYNSGGPIEAVVSFVPRLVRKLKKFLPGGQSDPRMIRKSYR